VRCEVLAQRHFEWPYAWLRFALCRASQARSRGLPPIAITHAKIFTLAGSTIEDGTLIFRDGKITGVGAGIDIPAGAPGD